MKQTVIDGQTARDWLIEKIDWLIVSGERESATWPDVAPISGEGMVQGEK